MFKISHIKDKSSASDYIEIIEGDVTYAIIDLNLGGSLQELKLKNEPIISSRATVPYEESYASAILFPFANRIENGQFLFNETLYQVPINKIEENNAIHGLVYDKTFKVIHYAAYENDAVVHVRYIEKNRPKGFPFNYVITLSYAFTRDSVELIVEVNNIDQSNFPFTVGWHPYFVSSQLEKSFLKLDSQKKIVVNDQRIPISEKEIDVSNGLEIENKVLDDCFILNNNHICFITPDYQLDFKFSSDENYLHLYIPPNRKAIAIEPQTGSANNFNDYRGLKILKPQDLYEIRWNIKVSQNVK